MARGGGKRTYTRDANGRFASTPGGGLGAARKAARPRSGRTSTLGARTSLKRSRAKLAAKDPADQRLSTALSTRAQKGAVTRGSKGLKAAKVAARARISGGQKGVIAKPIGLKRGMSTMKTGNLSIPVSKKLTKKPNTESKPKRKTKQQKADAYVERINRIGQGRSGVKASRAERIKKQAISFASGLAQYHKRERPKTLQELKKGLSEAFGNKKRMMNYSKFRKASPFLSGRPQSGKRSRVRPGQLDRAKGRLWEIKAATMNPFSKSNPSPARQNNSINMRSSEIVRRASSWYSGERPEGRAKPLTRFATTPSTSPVKIKGAESVPSKNKRISTNEVKKNLSKRYKLKTNALGKKTAASRGFIAALNRGQRGGFAESAPRLVFRRGKNQQITLSGIVETVKTGKMKQVGYRTSRGSVKLLSQSRRRKPKP